MPSYQEEQFPLPTPARLVRELHLKRPPWWMLSLLVVVVVGTWIPLVLIYRARGTTSRQPRVHFFMDMDKQAKFATQSAHPWFKDGRAMRGPIEGTLARGHLQHDPHFFDGFTKDANSGAIKFVTTMPTQVTVDERLLRRGQQRYEIYCTVCHGATGVGDGPVNQRALELKEPKWVPATNLMTQEIRDRADGQIFQAIRDGVRNMPSYGSQIDPNDRWAIVAYLRELQRQSPVSVTATQQGKTPQASPQEATP
ncbi:MAG: cytochrome c [Rubripirellula sp.]|nr:cytochrome c [Rubripirellula sp.]